MQLVHGEATSGSGSGAFSAIFDIVIATIQESTPRMRRGRLVVPGKKITPTGGGDPVSVILSDWQLGGGVPPVRSVRHWEEECVAPNSVLLNSPDQSFA